jgi:hypothetical protein
MAAEYKQKEIENRKKRRKTLTYEDLRHLGWKLSFHFRLKKVPKEDLLESLVANHDRITQCIHFDQIKKTLSEMPFSISDKVELEKLSRYLIEDEEEDDEIHEDSKQAISIVKSIFNRLLGCYEGKSEREYNLVNDNILGMLDKRKMTVESALDELPEAVDMVGVENFFARFPSFKLNHYDYEHIMWRLFLESRNIDRLNLKFLYKILKKKEKVNSKGIVEEFTIANLTKEIIRNMVDYSIELTHDVELDRLNRHRNERDEYFAIYEKSIKYWETPLQPNSLLKMLSEMLKSQGIELIFHDIHSYKYSKRCYNAVTSNSMRGKEMIYGMTLRMKQSNYNEEFENDFVDSIIKVSATSKTFRGLNLSNVLLFDHNDRDGFLIVKLCVLPVRSEEAYAGFLSEFKPRLEEKYGTVLTTLRKYCPIFYLEKDILDIPDIAYLEKKKEKIIRMKNGKWSYYQPADWIRYPLVPQQIPPDALAKWVTLYHPLGGFDFSSYGNINVCDDLGPNRFDVELSSFPLDQGIFLSPRLGFIMGQNQHGVFHANPIPVKHARDSEYYYILAFELLADPNRIRAPSVFKLPEKYLEKQVYGDYYVVNRPADVVLRALLLKRLSADEYINFGGGTTAERRAGKGVPPFTVRGFEESIHQRSKMDDDFEDKHEFESLLRGLNSQENLLPNQRLRDRVYVKPS